jgi:hypothetical protein
MKRQEVAENCVMRSFITCTLPIRMVESRRMRSARHIARMGRTETSYRLLVGKRPLGRPRRRCVDNIRTDFVETELGGTDWLVWLRIMTIGGLL